MLLCLFFSVDVGLGELDTDVCYWKLKAKSKISHEDVLDLHIFGTNLGL